MTLENKTYPVSFLYDTDKRIVFQNTWRNSYMAGEKYAARKVYWADIVHQCNQSGMIKNEWLRQHDISSKSFYYWQKKLRDEDFMISNEEETPSLMTDNRFVELSSDSIIPSVSSKSVTIHKSNISIDLDESVSDEFLLRILKAMNHA